MKLQRVQLGAVLGKETHLSKAPKGVGGKRILARESGGDGPVGFRSCEGPEWLE